MNNRNKIWLGTSQDELSAFICHQIEKKSWTNADWPGQLSVWKWTQNTAPLATRTSGCGFVVVSHRLLCTFINVNMYYYWAITNFILTILTIIAIIIQRLDFPESHREAPWLHCAWLCMIVALLVSIAMIFVRLPYKAKNVVVDIGLKRPPI